MKNLALVILVILISSCSNIVEDKKSYWVDSFGNRKTIIKKGKLEGKFNLTNLEGIDDVFGIGPVDNLKGEVTIYSGLPYISDLDENNNPRVVENWDVKAIFLAYGQSKNWNEIKVEQSLKGLMDIENYVRTKALKNSLDLEKSFPFRIEGIVEKMKYHIIYKKDDRPHNKKEHIKAKQRFNLKNEDVKIVGFWATRNKVGAYTHPGKRTHLHFISKSQKDSGHIDGIVIRKGATLFLPENK
jgi:acetolactate decarboxylase